MTFRPYQKEAFDAIISEISINKNCLVKMFCGSGKSIIMYELVKHLKQNLSVFVFPSLSLIDQFCGNYLGKAPNILRISSDNESTTEPYEISIFINKQIAQKIVCVTYQSFNVLLENLHGNKIDLCCFDEAHHAVGDTYQMMIFNNDTNISKSVFFTATPKNANGIIMWDRNIPSKSMCGNLVYEYSYLQGSMEGYLNPFEIRVDLFTENDNKSVYESISRAILTTGNNRVLTFHSTVNSHVESSVINFVDEEKFRRSFQFIVETEFKEKKNLYNKITMTGLDCKTNTKQRRQILSRFKKCDESQTERNVIILSSCETIGEGVDTNDANMCVFVEPKSSAVKIIQNIGRIVRKQIGDNKKKSTVLIPCWIDKEKYTNCNNDKVECDKMIRQDMMTLGQNFNNVFNVLSSLQKEQEDIYDACLNNHSSYTHNEVEMNFTTQGYVIGDAIGSGTFIETVELLIGKIINYDDYDNKFESSIDKFCTDENVCIEIHTDSIETPITVFNPQNGDKILRLFKTDGIFKPLLKKNGERSSSNHEKLNSIDANKKVNIILHTNDDIKVLWSINQLNDNFQLNFKSCILDCEFVDIWFEKFHKLKGFVISHNRIPYVISKCREQQSIAYWFNLQNINYSNKNHSMKNPERYTTWSRFLSDFNHLFISIYETWEAKFDEKKFTLLNYDYVWGIKMKSVREFITRHHRKPIPLAKDKWEDILGKWLHIQCEYFKILHQSKKYDTSNEPNKTDFYEHPNSHIRDDQFYTIWTDFKHKFL